MLGCLPLEEWCSNSGVRLSLGRRLALELSLILVIQRFDSEKNAAAFSAKIKLMVALFQYQCMIKRFSHMGEGRHGSISNTYSFSLSRGTNNLSDHLDTPFAGLVLKENGLIFTRPVEWTASPKGRQIELLSGGVSSLFHGPLSGPHAILPFLMTLHNTPCKMSLLKMHWYPYSPVQGVSLLSVLPPEHRAPLLMASWTIPWCSDISPKAHLAHASLLLSVTYRFFTYFYAPHLLYLAFTLWPPWLPFSLSTCPELLRGH